MKPSAGGLIARHCTSAIARRFGHDSNKDMHSTYEDTIDTFAPLLGLTSVVLVVMPTRRSRLELDYYALYGVFASTKFSFAGCEAIQQPELMRSPSWI
ncbi:MAG: hypothetical protein R3B96_21235 [Pirellulaceae bacterium]